MRLYSVALLPWHDQPFDQGVREAAAAGFQACELWQAAFDLADHEAVVAARRALNAHRMHALTMHTTGGSVSALDETERRAAVERVSSGFTGFAALGGYAAIVHPSHRLQPGEPPDAQIEALRRSLPDLIDRAEAAGIRLAFENLPAKGDGLPRPLGPMAELQRVLADTPPLVGICLDTGHAVLNGLSPAEEVRAAGDRLIALHIHDSDAASDHWMPGDRSIDWAAFNAALIETEFAGAWTFEVIRAAEAEGPMASAVRARGVADAWDAGRYA